MKILVVSFLMALLSSASPKPETLDVYVIDVEGGKENNPPDDFIANPEPTDCQGRWIKLSARLDGSFVVTNGRNGFSKTYEAHR